MNFIPEYHPQTKKAWGLDAAVACYAQGHAQKVQTKSTTMLKNKGYGKPQNAITAILMQTSEDSNSLCYVLRIIQCQKQNGFHDGINRRP